MDKNLVKNIAKVALLVGAFGLAGCAASFPDTVHNHYKAPASMAKVPGAENVTVVVIVHDHKKRHDEISYTRDTFGSKLSTVYLHIDKAFDAAIDTALSKRGFHTGPGGVQVQVVVKHFFLPEKMGFSDITHTGHLVMQVSVPSVAYQQMVHIQHFKKSIGPTQQLFTLSAGRTASANALMAEGVNKLVNNPQFIAALLKAGHAGAVVPRIPAG